MKDHPALIRAAPPLAIKLAPTSADTGVIEGYASVFGGEPDSYGDIIAPGAYADCLAALKARGESVAMLWAHDAKVPIGRWTDVSEDSKGLHVRGVLNLDTSRGRDAYAHAKAGDVTGLSIGYRVLDSQYHAGGTQTLKCIDLHEVSLVTFPAARSARITGVKSLGSQRDLQILLHESGLARGAAAKIAAAGWQALTGDEDQPDLKSLEARIKAATAEIRSMKG